MGTARIYFRRNCRTRSRPRTRQLRTTLGRHRTSLHHFEVETLARLQLPESAEKGFWRLCPLRPLCAVCAKSIAQPSYGTSTVAVRPARQPQQQRLRPLPEERAYVYVRSCTCRSSERPPAQRFCCRNPLRGRSMHPCCGALTAWRRVRACTARASASLSSGAFQDARLALCFALPCAALRPHVPPLCTSSAPSMPDCPSTCAREEARCLSVREARQGGAATGASCLVFVRRSLQTHLNMGPSTSCTQPRPVAGRPPASIIARRASAQASKRAPRPPGAHGDAARAAKCHPPRASIQNC